MFYKTKLLLYSLIASAAFICQSNASGINGVFFEQNCNWMATEENGTQSLLALLYVSQNTLSDNVDIPFFISFIINAPLEGSFKENHWFYDFSIKIDGKKYDVKGDIKKWDGGHQLLVQPGKYFNQINAAMKAGNIVQVVGLEDVNDQFFSLKGYTKTAAAITKACAKE